MKMNRFFLFSLCVMLWGGLEAQITLTANDYFPEAGDTLFTVIDDLPTGVVLTGAPTFSTLLAMPPSTFRRAPSFADSTREVMLI